MYIPLFLATIACGLHTALGAHEGHRNLRHHNRRNNPAESPEEEEFDFYVYSMTYQPEFCREHSSAHFAGCQNPQQYWEGQLTVHGLWPERNDGSWPAACTSEPFDLNSILSQSSSITSIDALEKNWPNVKSPTTSSSHTSFWEHEWTKHGTCSGLSQKDYFESALQLLLPTPPILQQAYDDNFPPQGTPVHVLDKKQLIQGYNGDQFSVVTVCNDGYLSEVRICVEKLQGGKPGKRMNCPLHVLQEDTCGDRIEIPIFQKLTVGKTSEIVMVE